MHEIWKLPRTQDWSYKQKLEKERISLGFYYSGHPLNYYNDFSSALNLIESSEFINNPEILLNAAGVVFQASERSSRKGRFMRVLLSDKKSLYEINAYSEVYRDVRNIIKIGAELYIKLIVVKDDNGVHRFVAKEIDDLRNKVDKLVSGFNISIKKDANLESLFERIKFYKNCNEIIKSKSINMIFNLHINEKENVLLNINYLVESIVSFYKILSLDEAIESIVPIIKN